MAYSPFQFISLIVRNVADGAKALKLQVSNSATTNKTLTLQASHTDDRTVTLPDITGILESQANKDVANGYAGLDGSAQIPTSTLPADIQKYANLGAFPGTGNIKLIYLAEDTKDMYEWTGSAYSQIGGVTAGVATFNGRTGAVVPTTGDYIAGQVTGAIKSLTLSSVDTTIPTYFGTGGIILRNTNGVTIDSGNNMADVEDLFINGDFHFQDPTGGIIFRDGGQTLKLQAPADIVSNIVYKLPSEDGGDGDVLTTDGAGQMAWETPTSPFTFTDWTSFTPTSTLGVGGTRVYTGEYRQIGQSLDLRITLAFTGGQGGSTAIRFDMPAGFTIDTTKLTSTTDIYYSLGDGVFNNGGAQGYIVKAMFYDSSPDQLNIMYFAGSPPLALQFATNAPASIGADSYVSFSCFGIPIV